jgi:hypothetical protein
VHHVGRDADQPGPHLDVVRPVGRPPPEGDQERLAEQVVGEVTDPAAEIPVHRRRVPVEEHREALRLLDRPLDQFAVRRLGLRERLQPRDVRRWWTVGHLERQYAHEW